MAINPAELETPIIYDFDLIERMAGPTMGGTMVRHDVMRQLERMGVVSNPNGVTDASIAVSEITKDVLTHGKETEPRLVILQAGLAGAAIHSFSVEDVENKEVHEGGEDLYHNGEALLRGMYDEDYVAILGDDDVFERHLLIRGDIDVEMPRIRRDN